MRKVLKMIGIVLVGLIVLLVVALVSGLIYERLSESRDAARFPAPVDSRGRVAGGARAAGGFVFK